MSNSPILTAYVSEIDQLLQTFDKEHPALSPSQAKERDKYQRIYALRDKTDQVKKPASLWEEF